jgi:2-oxoisovalerate dehydrogenase E1 component
MFTKTNLAKAWYLMATARSMADIYENNRQVCKYVHSTSKGHEAIQIATGLQLLSCDYISPYYRDDSMLLSLGFTPYEMMLQLLAKANDPFSGGRSYYCHPSSLDTNKAKIIHQSSATGMQVIPTTGVAQGLQYLEQINSPLFIKGAGNELPVVICSLGDNSVTEGEVSEAFQFAVLKELPIIYLVQDNNWGISVTADEARAMNAFEYADGFPGMHRMQVDGSDFMAAYETMRMAIAFVRNIRRPVLVHATVPLLGHHTSGVRKEFYRSIEDLDEHTQRDPYPKMRSILISNGFTELEITSIEDEAKAAAQQAFQEAMQAADPLTSTVTDHVFVSTPITDELGIRTPVGGEKIIMVDAALHAIEDLMEEHDECLLYGQDVGRRLGGVFREAATLAEKFGDHRVFNTAIQEALYCRLNCRYVCSWFKTNC